MTREEICALRAGPGLDASVAAAIMGCRVVSVRSIESQVGAVDEPAWLSCGCVVPRPVPAHCYDFGTPLHGYSVHPWAAWHIVERLRADGWAISIDSTQGPDGPWKCAIDHRSDPFETSTLEYAETMPLAVCRAALIAVGRLKPEAE